MIEHAAQLREAREAAGLSLADVAQRLRLSPRHLEAIEAGDWERLPGTAFTRGAVRSYARLLAVDSEALLRQLPAAQDPELLRPAPSLEASLPRGRSGRNLHLPRGRRLSLAWILAGILMAGIAAALIWPDAIKSLRESVRSRQHLLSASGTRSSEMAPQTAPGATEPPADTSASPASSAASAPASPPQSPSAAVSDETSAVSASAPTQPPLPVPPSSPSSAQGSASVGLASGASGESGRPKILVISSKRDSWVEVRDSSDRVLHMGLVRPATPLRMELSAPVSYTIGNAAATLVEFAGRPVDLLPQTQPGTNIAKGSLP